MQVVEGLLDPNSLPNDPEAAMRYREVLLRILKCLQDPRLYGVKWVNNHVTRWISRNVLIGWMVEKRNKTRIH